MVDLRLDGEHPLGGGEKIAVDRAADAAIGGCTTSSTTEPTGTASMSIAPKSLTTQRRGRAAIGEDVVEERGLAAAEEASRPCRHFRDASRSRHHHRIAAD
jgi:hypothetical protein